MCTVTLRHDAAGLLVTMNRDEARSRAPERPPVEAVAGGVRWLGPGDGARGGTWFGINAHGLVACLLNRYQDRTGAIALSAPGAPSRGRVVPQAMAFDGVPAAAAWAAGVFDPEPYPPFTLVLAAPGAPQAVRIDWDGLERRQETLAGPWGMITSSLFSPAEVIAWRQAAFAEWLAAGAPFDGALPAFHLHCPPGADFHAPLMSRDLSCTRSIVQAEAHAGSTAYTLRHGPVSNGMVTLQCYHL